MILSYCRCHCSHCLKLSWWELSFLGSLLDFNSFREMQLITDHWQARDQCSVSHRAIANKIFFAFKHHAQTILLYAWADMAPTTTLCWYKSCESCIWLGCWNPNPSNLACFGLRGCRSVRLWPTWLARQTVTKSWQSQTSLWYPARDSSCTGGK